MIRGFRAVKGGAHIFVVALIDSAGDIVESYEYDVYGAVTVHNAQGEEIPQTAVANRYTFTGREMDWQTGLMHYRARAYSPSLGRFLQRDPVPMINLYEYAKSSPVRFRDPRGRQSADDAVELLNKLQDYVDGLTTAIGIWQDWEKIKKAIQGDGECRDEMLSKYGQKLLEEGVEMALKGAAGLYFSAFMAGFDMGEGMGKWMAEVLEKAFRINECCICAGVDTKLFAANPYQIQPPGTQVPVLGGTSYMVKLPNNGGLLGCHKDQSGKYYVRREKGFLAKVWIAIFGGKNYYWVPCDQDFLKK